jgi:hypothetical protein
MITLTTILQTKDYNLFKNASINRDVNLYHVKRLEESFSKKYLLSPIIVNKRMEIIDGQHRFEAARNLGLPINFFICESYDFNEIQMLNAQNKSWVKNDYLKAYCDDGRPDYLLVKKFCEMFPVFSLRTSLSILGYLTNNDTRDFVNGKLKSRSFEEGSFKVKNWERSLKHARMIIELSVYFPEITKNAVTLAILPVFNLTVYDHKRMLNKFELYGSSLLSLCATQSKYREMFEHIYNYHTSKKVNLRFEQSLK